MYFSKLYLNALYNGHNFNVTEDVDIVYDVTDSIGCEF